MKNIKNNFFIIIITFVLFILCFFTTSLGYSLNINDNTYNTSDFLDEYKSILILYKDNKYHLYVSKSNSHFMVYTFQGVGYITTNDGGGMYFKLFYDSIDDLLSTSSFDGFNNMKGHSTSLGSSSNIIFSNKAVYNDDGDVVFREACRRGGDNSSGNITGGGNTTDDSEHTEDNNPSWLDNLWNWFSDLFDAICNLASNIADAIGEVFSGLFDGVKSLVDYLNPFSENFILKDVFSFLSDIISFINPFSEDFILKGVLDAFANLLDWLNPFSENFFVYKLIELLGDLLKWLFVPDDDFFSSNIDNLKSMLSEKIPYEDYVKIFGDIENVNSSGNNNISINGYKVGSNYFNSNDFLNFSFITKYKDTWYSWVRGIVFILLVIYNINQVMKLFRGYGLASSSGNQPSGGGKE